MSSRKVKTCEPKTPKSFFSKTCSTSKKAQLQEATSCKDTDRQPRDMLPFRNYYKALGEVFQAAFAQDEELDALYSKVREKTETGLKNLMHIKSQTKGNPGTAILHTTVGQKVNESRKRLNECTTRGERKPPRPLQRTLGLKVQQESGTFDPEVATTSHVTPYCHAKSAPSVPMASLEAERQPKRKLLLTNYPTFREEMLDVPVAFDFVYQQKPNSPAKKKRILDLHTSSPNSKLEHISEPESSCIEPVSEEVTAKFRELAVKPKSLKSVIPTLIRSSPNTIASSLTETHKRKEVQLQERQMEENISRSPSAVKVSSAAEHLITRNEDSQNAHSVLGKESVEGLGEFSNFNLTTFVVDEFSKLSVVEDESQTRKGSVSNVNQAGSHIFSVLQESSNTTENETTFVTAVADSFLSNEISIASEYNSPELKITKDFPDPKKLSNSSAHTKTLGTIAKFWSKNKIKRDDSTQSDIPSEALDHNGNTVLKKWSPLAQSPTAGSAKPGFSGVRFKGGLQEKAVLKTKFNKASSSSSLYSSCSSISVAETVINKTIKLPKNLASSRERLGSSSPSSNKCLNDPEEHLKKEEEIRRLQEKQKEVLRKKQMYIQQKQEMQRKKNAAWKSKVQRKKQEAEEEQVTLEELKANLAGLDGKNAMDKYESLMKGRLNPKLFSVVQKHFREPMMAAASSCPDINAAMLKKEAYAKPRLMSQAENSAAASTFQNLENPKNIVPPQLGRNFVSQQNLGNKMFADEPEDDDTFENDTNQDPECCSEINTYDITVYEDYDESLEYRENKRIPEWASNLLQLKQSLFRQQPKLMELIPKSKSIFPKKNFGEKMFPNIP
ncbi:unnamed protein product [Allacma fusca]|uniref:Uncharacterized protein n=1 Tax=Allacma fusca TaxID=39272 RepID=A0A8J2KR85_9HEXA|nr:unnamed protein product [Allacma fusca]